MIWSLIIVTDPSRLPDGHPERPPRRVGLLLVNLGTPDGTDYRSMRRYLAEFLSDRRVIELNPLLWQIILQLFILPFRPRKSARAYRAIWDRERDESPLRGIMRSIAARVGDEMAGRELIVDWAMRYGQPAIAARIEALAAEGCDRILIFPLYPQYAAATTASAADEAFRALMRMRFQPAVRVVPPYYDDAGYIAALAASVEATRAKLDFAPDALLASFHGLPAELLEKGDPYYCHCMKTARLLREALALDPKNFHVGFQSRFGPKKWLEPYIEELFRTLPAQGVRDLLVIAPGFAADCVETLEEIAIGGADLFRAHGGRNFVMVPCLNDGEGHIAMLRSIAERELSGWMQHS
ncbi:MAG: ferrochelatase [Rhodothalassiaceae bacterium]